MPWFGVRNLRRSHAETQTQGVSMSAFLSKTFCMMIKRFNFQHLRIETYIHTRLEEMKSKVRIAAAIAIVLVTVIGSGFLVALYLPGWWNWWTGELEEDSAIVDSTKRSPIPAIAQQERVSNIEEAIQRETLSKERQLEIINSTQMSDDNKETGPPAQPAEVQSSEPGPPEPQEAAPAERKERHEAPPRFSIETFKRANPEAFAMETKYTRSGFVGCFTEEELNRLLTIVLQNDKVAFSSIVKSGRCVILNGGAAVYVMDALPSGIVKIRPRASTETIWTVADALQ